MKKIFILFVLTLFSNTIFGQTNTPAHNKTLIRLTILNDKGELLMKESDYGWMTIATFYTQRQSINEVVDSISNNYGFKLTKPTLAGIFTYKYGFKKSADIRQLYTAKYIKGNLKSGNHKLKWLPKKEAIAKLKSTVASLGEMTAQTLDFPETIWGGTFLLNKDDKWKLSSKQIEEFYPLRNQFSIVNSETEQVQKTLQKYMDGSSYSKQKLIKSAFVKNATLYLTGRDGSFKRYTPEEYANFFKNRKEGEFNGRSAKILAIEIVKDIATAKVEIAGPNRKWVYIDLFLLKKTGDDWNIISKTATRIDDGK